MNHPVRHCAFSILRPSRNTWRWMGGLPEERKWGAALGHVDGALTIAAGIDYGDDTIDVYDGSQWSREKQ